MTCSRFSLKIIWFTGKVKYTRKKSISFFLYNPGCLGNKALFEDLASTQNHVRFTSELVLHTRIDWWGFHKDRALVLAPADGPLSHLWPLDWIFLTDFTPEVSNFQHFQPLRQVLTETMISDKQTIGNPREITTQGILRLVACLYLGRRLWRWLAGWVVCLVTSWVAACPPTRSGGRWAVLPGRSKVRQLPTTDPARRTTFLFDKRCWWMLCSWCWWFWCWCKESF